MKHFWKDVRHGVRVLRKSPGFTLVAVIALALGIGANTTIFSAINALLLHPFAFRDIDQLVVIWESRPKVEVETKRRRICQLSRCQESEHVILGRCCVDQLVGQHHRS